MPDVPGAGSVGFDHGPLQHLRPGKGAVVPDAPAPARPAGRAVSSIRSVISPFRSHLLTQTAAGISKCLARERTRSRSCSPETVGSVTASTREAPVTDAITGQPIPGGPSTRIRRLFSRRCAGPPSAPWKPACRSSRRQAEPGMDHRAAPRIGDHPLAAEPLREIDASFGQNRTHTPHPSQEIGSTENVDAPHSTPFFRTASNRQYSSHTPQPVQTSRLITATCPPRNSWRSMTRGERTRCRSAASTSQSAPRTGRSGRPATPPRWSFPCPLSR